jgi:hypothetical protein
MNSLLESLENSFQNIDTKIAILNETIRNTNESACLENRTVNNTRDLLNDHRINLIQKLNSSSRELISKINSDTKQLKIKVKQNKIDSSSNSSNNNNDKNNTWLEFKSGCLNLQDINFEHMVYENNFDCFKKLKYINLITDNIVYVNLTENLRNSANVFVFPLSKEKLFVHFKTNNLIQIILTKNNKIVNELKLNEFYYCKFKIFNSKIFAFLFDRPNTIFNVFNENLKLINFKCFSNQSINFVSINAQNELICWSSEGYKLIDLDKRFDELITFSIDKLNGRLLHLSRERIYCLDSDMINIYCRFSKDLISNFKVNLSSMYCFEFDSSGRFYAKTKQNDFTNKIICYDQDGKVLCSSHSQIFEIYDYFEFIDNNHINFIDFTQNNIIIF